MKKILPVILLLVCSTAVAKEFDPMADGAQVESQVRPQPSNALKTTWESLRTKVSGWLGGTKTAPQQVATKQVTTTPEPVSVVTLPDVKSSTHSATSAQMSQAKQALRNHSFTQASPGRAHGENLKLNKQGVPVFPMMAQKTVKDRSGKSKVVKVPIKLNKIPRLDVGEEPTISKSDFTLPNFEFSLNSLARPEPLPSPEGLSENRFHTLAAQNVVPATGPRLQETTTTQLAKPVTRESVQGIQYVISPAVEVVEQPVKEYSPEQLQMLAALILARKSEKCFIVLGLFDKLSESEVTRNEANYHLGQCAASMKLYSMSFARLTPVIASEEVEFARPALLTLAKDLPQQYEIEFSRLIRELKNAALTTGAGLEQVNYLVAKGAYKEGLYPVAKKWAEKIGAQSDLYPSAQFIVATSIYNDGNRRKAIKSLQELRAHMQKSELVDKNLSSLIAINLGRMLFSEGRFQEALEMYLAIDREHPLWVQGLTEQGWLQLAMEDFAGAIGNMYSLHSPYFKSVYKPESFAIRSIGYLNICQYGDAYKSLSWLEEEYRPWSSKVNKYVSSRGNDEQAYFSTTKDYLRGRSDEDVDGLPYQVIREAARRRDYLNKQTSLNGKEDEFARYDGVNESIKKEKARVRSRSNAVASRYKSLKTQIERAERDRQQLDQVDTWKRQARADYELAIGLKFQLQMLEISRQNYIQFRENAIAYVNEEKGELRRQVGKVLMKHVQRLQSEMDLMLGNNELLRYEVFSGSGENIRYQVAGGETAEMKRIPASVKPQKQMNWTFEGEYWADEIGNYRSTIKNNCGAPQTMEEFFKAKQETSEDGKTAAKEGDGQ